MSLSYCKQSSTVSSLAFCVFRCQPATYMRMDEVWGTGRETFKVWLMYAVDVGAVCWHCSPLL